MERGLPGRFERSFDTIESLFRIFAASGAKLNREHWSISVVAQISLSIPVDDIENALKHAWKTIRYDHPQIACVAEGDTKVYEVPDDFALKTWLDSTVITTSSTENSESLLASFQPSPLAMLYWLPHSAEILIHSSHWRLDGIGMLALLGNFLTALAEPREIVFGLEWKNLSPGLDEVAGFNTRVDVEAERLAGDALDRVLKSFPSLGVPIKSEQMPHSTRRCQLVLPPDVTLSIIDACKTKGVGVNAGALAALVIATKEKAASDVEDRDFFSNLPFSYRPYLNSAYKDWKLHPVSTWMLGMPIVLSPSSSFEENAEKTQQFFKSAVSPSKSQVSKFVVPYMQKYMAMLKAPADSRPQMPPSTTPDLNSLGIIDNLIAARYGDFVEVSNFWLGVEMLTQQLEVYVWTFQGSMTFSACYNEAFYDEKFVVEFLKLLVKVLAEELNVQHSQID